MSSPPEPPQQVPQEVEDDVAGSVAAILATGLAAATALALLKKAMAPLKIGPKAVRAALKVLDSTHFDPPLPGVVGARAFKDAWKFRGWFLLNSAKRIQRGMSQGVPLKDLLVTELRYARMHAEMQRRRIEAARQAVLAGQASQINTAGDGDGAGPLVLGKNKGLNVFRWRTRADDRVTPDCLALEGRVFPVNSPPNGIYPGAMHLRCRCWPEPIKAPVRRYRVYA